MDQLRHYQRLFAYNAWANREAVAAIRAMREPAARAMKILAHVAAAEWLWFTRVRKEPQRMAVWPDLSAEECGSALDEIARAWNAFLKTRTPDGLRDPVSYTNSKGEPWRNTVEDVLLHVVMHSGYHRGQIASELRAAGVDPPYTDFIHAVRRRLIG